MDVEFVVHMDNRLREAAIRCAMQRHSPRFLLIVVLGTLVVGTFAFWPLLNVHADWWRAIVPTTLLILFFLLILRIRTRGIRQALEAANRLGDYDAAYRITDELFETKSPYSSDTLPWRAFVRLERHPEFWLLYCTHATAYVLPAKVMAGAVGEFVMRKVRENGGKVK